MRFRCKRIVTAGGIVDGYIETENQRFKGVFLGDAGDSTDLTEYTIIPGIFDTHVHGTQGFLPWEGEGIDCEAGLDGYLKGAASEGVTLIFPTLYGYEPQYNSDIAAVRQLAKYAKKTSGYNGARVAGIHYEGPYLHRVGEQGAGVEPASIDLPFVQSMIDAADGTFKLMGLAPELPRGGELIELLVKNGVTAALAHTDCNSREAFEAFDRGVTVATHLCNVMVGMHHRDVGGLGAALLDDRIYTELICDGLHVCNDMLKIILRAKPNDHIMLVSDCTGYSGAPGGRYESFWGDSGEIYIDKLGFVREPGGRIRGSSKSALYGIRNLVENIGLPLELAIKFATENPCKKYGIADRGSITAGNFADFSVIDKDYNVLFTYVEGEKVYDASTEAGNIFNKNLLSKRIGDYND